MLCIGNLPKEILEYHSCQLWGTSPVLCEAVTYCFHDNKINTSWKKAMVVSVAKRKPTELAGYYSFQFPMIYKNWRGGWSPML